MNLRLTVAFVLLICALPARSAENLLKNGSFEGGTRYWFDLDDKRIVEDGADGGQSLRIDKGGVQSAAFLLQPGKAVTISFSAKAVEGETTIGWQCTPCSREVGVKNGQTWGMKSHHPVKITGEWKRYSFKFTPTAAQDGFWPRPTYMVQVGDGDKPWLLDAVTVGYDAGADGYIGYRDVEAFVDSADLKGYRDESGNLLTQGQTVNLKASAYNPGASERALKLRCQLVDYEGVIALGDAIEKRVVVGAGKAAVETFAMKLVPNGMVLARVTALGADGKVIDQSDLPLCSLPHPSAASKPDWRERFGGSLFGPHNASLCAKMGFAWTRWRPHMNWSDHQKDGPDRWQWQDKVLEEQEGLGISSHMVLYDRPKWAFASDKEQLPKDMQWAAADPRWDDIAPQCAWDKYVVASVKHYKGRSLVYEIENEPEFDGWEKKNDLYAKFTIRTARLIKQTDADAKVMVDNVYGIPSGLNRYLLEKGAGKFIDVISWHDYHDGGLADATAIRRMRAALDDLGCKHIEIWFNEGWAYTNTAVDEPAVALTHLNSAQSTNAMVSSVAELTAAGQEKTILFHTGYEEHGMSFWDYAGPGTMLWDWYGYPLPLVPAWNTLVYHIGLSERVAIVRPEGATFCIFQDLRNGRGVMVAYADREVKADVTVEMPVAGLLAEDVMGNVTPLPGKALKLSKTGRPVFLYAADKTTGKSFSEKLTPLDRKNASFVSGGQGGKSWKLPAAWEGSKKDSTDGNPALADGKPVWRLDQIWPVDSSKPANYRPLAWRDGWWIALKDGFGGQPKAEMKDSAIRMEFRASQSASPGEKLCGLSFVAPEAGNYKVEGSVELKLWDGDNKTRLSILRKTKDAATEIASVAMKRNERSALTGISTHLEAGDELVLLPRIEGMFVGGDVTLRDLTVSSGAAVTYRLPRAWDGAKKGSAEGNPVAVAEKPLWRLDQVWPDDPTIASHFTPLIWNGVEWNAEKNGAGGQPQVKVEDGAFKASVRGSWTGNEGQRVAGLVFIAPGNGIYHVTGQAFSKSWEGGAKVYRLGVFKKDTQRATQEKVLELPRDGLRVMFDFKVELSAGHELALLPLMPDWHNATTTTIEDLAISVEQPEAERKK